MKTFKNTRPVRAKHVRVGDVLVRSGLPAKLGASFTPIPSTVTKADPYFDTDFDIDAVRIVTDNGDVYGAYVERELQVLVPEEHRTSYTPLFSSLKDFKARMVPGTTFTLKWDKYRAKGPQSAPVDVVATVHHITTIGFFYTLPGQSRMFREPWVMASEIVFTPTGWLLEGDIDAPSRVYEIIEFGKES